MLISVGLKAKPKTLGSEGNRSMGAFLDQFGQYVESSATRYVCPVQGSQIVEAQFKTEYTRGLTGRMYNRPPYTEDDFSFGT